jgi:hypothetical protein
VCCGLVFGLELQLYRSTLEISSASTTNAVRAALVDLKVVPAGRALTHFAKESAQKVALNRASSTGAFHCDDEVLASNSQMQARALDAMTGGYARGCGK